MKKYIVVFLLLLSICYTVNAQRTSPANNINSKYRVVNIKSECKKYIISGFLYQSNDTLYMSNINQAGMYVVNPICVLTNNPYLSIHSTFQLAFYINNMGDTIMRTYYSKNISIFKIGLDVFYVFQNYFNNCTVDKNSSNTHANCTKKDTESINAFSVVTFVYSNKKGITWVRVENYGFLDVFPYLKKTPPCTTNPETNRKN